VKIPGNKKANSFSFAGMTRVKFKRYILSFDKIETPSTVGFNAGHFLDADNLK